jgi:GntR family transcriptional regulator, arabinose operon transcriptional repressor
LLHNAKLSIKIWLYLLISCNIKIVSTRKYLPILQALQAQIASGKFKADQRLPSENELALRFKVSRPTAARAIRELANLGLIERRVGSGTFLRTSSAARSSQRTFGLLVPGLGNTEILDPICNEITRLAQASHASVLWGDPSNSQRASNADEALRLCRLYIDRHIDGVFFAPIEIGSNRQKVNLQIASAFSNANIPTILLDRDVLDFPDRSNFDLVGIDNFHAGLTLANHVISLGHRRLGFLARPDHPSTTDLRLAGCREAAARNAVSSKDLKFFSGNPSDAGFVRRMLSSPGLDAVICSNDMTAALLMQTLTSALGLTLPRDLAIAGFDDVNYSTLLAVPLTTMHQPCQMIAQAAMNAIRTRLQTPELPARQILTSAKLIVRQSCGA